MKKIIIGSALFLSPALAFAAELTKIKSLIRAIGDIIGLVTPIIFALILVYFFWGLLKFVMNATDSDARKEGRQMMVWGIVALFVASSVWGLVRFIGDSLGVGVGGSSDNGSITVPSVPIPGNN